MEVYVTSSVGICGADRINDCATRLAAETDKLDAGVAAGPILRPCGIIERVD